MEDVLYNDLINAIIIQAVRDYRDALNELQKARAMMDDCEKFFRSSWYQTLTSVDGEMLMQKLKAEVTVSNATKFV